MTRINCPYCGKETESRVPSAAQTKPIKTVCRHCHRPIAVYAREADMQMHVDRSIRAVTVLQGDFLNEKVYLEVVESDLADPQILPVPVGDSVLGRHNKNSTADLQVLTDDVDLGRNQARIQLTEKGTLTVADFGSNAGTYVNGLLLQPQDRMRLEDGDVLMMGSTTIIVHLDLEE